MNDFEKNMSRYWTDYFPQTYSFLGSPEEAAKILTSHKDQIHFLDAEGTDLVKTFIYSTGMGDKLFIQKPFEGYFSTIETYAVGADEKALKKWLYQRGIPFNRWVYLDLDNLAPCVMMTWKMVIKYCGELFYSMDALISDSTLRWGLYYFHSGQLFFGKDINYDRTIAEEFELIKNEFFRKMNER
ncbi:MAG: hypothetical protein R2792_14735 [Saprospiraceae bacterium]